MTAFLRKDMLGLSIKINQEDQMRSLSADRFLKWFAGDLKNRRKLLTSILKDQKPETEVDMAVGPDRHASEKDITNQESEGNDLRNEEEQNKKNDTEAQNE
jgi:hypothetical protein